VAHGGRGRNLSESVDDARELSYLETSPPRINGSREIRDEEFAENAAVQKGNLRKIGGKEDRLRRRVRREADGIDRRLDKFPHNERQ